MASFFGISPGEEKTAPGLRVSVTPDGESVWMHGKWLDLGPDHAVVWVDAGAVATFVRPDGKRLRLGQFPGWPVYGSGKNAAHAAMVNIGQFRGGRVEIAQPRRRGPTNVYPIEDGVIAEIQDAATCGGRSARVDHAWNRAKPDA